MRGKNDANDIVKRTKNVQSKKKGTIKALNIHATFKFTGMQHMC